MTTIKAVRVVDVRFPTSATMDGSDAMNPDGDYSAAYVVVETDDPGLCGYGLTFTIGRGNDVCVLVAQQLGKALVGRDVDVLSTGRGIGRLYRDLVDDSQLRWLGPEKGVVHLATAAVLNAAWDLVARRAGKPLWRFLCDMAPAELVEACDFRYLSNVLTSDEALAMLRALEPTRTARIAELAVSGYPAYTTSPGWLGYDDEKLRRLVREAVADGWTQVKLKVGGNLEDDIRRLGIAREELGPDRELMIDGNQVWEVGQAIEWVSALARFRPRWIEEPTSPDDIAGHAQVRAGVAPIGVATGEHAHNRVMFKQLLQAGAIDFCQIDSCRLASINEIVPVLLMAAKFGVPVCPHAGGVGLCEYVQHLSVFDHVCVSGTVEGRVAEYVDNLHEHFVDPVVIMKGAYRLPTAPGYSIEMLADSVARYTFPDGAHWGRPAMTGFPEAPHPDTVATARAELLAVAAKAVAEGPYDATWESLCTRPTPAWFTDAKFGIFVHWLASSVPAFGTEWYPRTMYLEQTPEYAHHRATYGGQESFGHKDFLPMFTGGLFDADDWTALVARSGARYLVPVAEHHDGFSLSHTALSRWNATRIGPRRDVIAELADSARRLGLDVGVSSHRAENWWFFHGGRRIDSDVLDPQWADLYGPARDRSSPPDEAFLDDWLARTVELVERHRPEVVWFDWWIEEPAFEPYLRRFAAYYYNTVPAGVINYKWDAFPAGAAVQDVERGSVRTIRTRPFQNDTSTSRVGWSWLRENDFKPVAEIVADLIDTVSKNGSLLLNIGPRPDGTIDPAERALLEGVGDWMAVHGDAVHGTRPWLVFGEGPTEQSAGSFVDAVPTAWTSADIRFTCRGDTLFATFLAPPTGATVDIRSLGTALRIVDADIVTVEMLGSGPVAWRRTPDALVVHLPEGALGELPGCLRIELAPVPPPTRIEPSIAE